jgi:hypothetical protein
MSSTFRGPSGDWRNSSRQSSIGSAATNTAPATTRALGDESRPAGNDSRMTAKTKYHRFCRTPDTVKTSGDVDWRIRNVAAQTIAKPVISAPMRLSGRRAHAIAPLAVNDAPTMTDNTDVMPTPPNPWRATIGTSIDPVPAAASATEATTKPAGCTRLKETLCCDPTV